MDHGAFGGTRADAGADELHVDDPVVGGHCQEVEACAGERVWRCGEELKGGEHVDIRLLLFFFCG